MSTTDLIEFHWAEPRETQMQLPSATALKFSVCLIDGALRVLALR